MTGLPQLLRPSIPSRPLEQPCLAIWHPAVPAAGCDIERLVQCAGRCAQQQVDQVDQGAVFFKDRGTTGPALRGIRFNDQQRLAQSLGASKINVGSRQRDDANQ
jgi:hypothetical protein